MERWRWSKSKVRRLLTILQKDHTIIRKTDRKKTTLFIINYDSYQGRETTERPPQKLPGDNTDDNTDDTQSRSKEGKRKTLRDSSNPAVKEFIDFWYQTFKGKFGEAYKVTGGKEGSLVKSLLKTYPLDRLKELAGVFFKSTDPFIQKSGYTIGTFASQVNKLVVEETQRRSSW